MDKLISLVGLIVMIGIAYLVSDNKKAINWKLVGIGVGMQLVFGLLILKWSPGQQLFNVLNDVVTKLLDFTKNILYPLYIH